MKKIRIFLAVLAIFFLLACEEAGLNLKIRFDHVAGLTADDYVIFESNRIGQVTRVFYTQAGDYLVDVKIEDNFADAVTENARFFIIEEPADSEKKAVEMIQIREGGELLADGATVEGTTRSSALLQKMLEDFDEQTSRLGGQIEKFLEDLSQLSQSAEIKQLQKDLEQLGRKMEKAGEATRDKIQKEVLPLIRESLDRLKKRLEKFGREKEVEPLERQLDKLTIT